MPPSYLVVHIELYVFREGADVPPRSAVIVHHGRYSGVVESLRDPLELHGGHVVFLLLTEQQPPTAFNCCRYLPESKAPLLRLLI